MLIENEDLDLYFSEDEQAFLAQIALTPIPFLDQPGFDPIFHTHREWVYKYINNIMYVCNIYSCIKSLMLEEGQALK